MKQKISIGAAGMIVIAIGAIYLGLHRHSGIDSTAAPSTASPLSVSPVLIDTVNTQRHRENLDTIVSNTKLDESANVSCRARLNSSTFSNGAALARQSLGLAGNYAEQSASYQAPSTDNITAATIANEITDRLTADSGDNQTLTLLSKNTKYIGLAICSSDDRTFTLQSAASHSWQVVVQLYGTNPALESSTLPNTSTAPPMSAATQKAAQTALTPTTRAKETIRIPSPPHSPASPENPAIPSTPVTAPTCSHADDTAQSEYINWNNQTWWARNIYGNPGNNNWGRMYGNVCVLTDGSLQLGIQNVNNAWYSSEVDLEGPSLGYGQYSFTYDVDPAAAPNTILGLFVYDKDAPAQSYREIDIELSKWGDSANTSSAWYSVQDVTDHRERISDHGLSTGPYTSKFIWEAGQIYFSTVDAHGKLIGEQTVRSGVQDPGNARVAMNFWLMDGTAPATTHPKARIYNFTYTPSITHALTKAASFTPRFDTPTYWASYRGASVTDDELELPAQTNYPEAYAGTVLDLNDSSYTSHIAQVPELGNGTTEADFKLEYNADNALQLYISGGQLCGFYIVDGSKTARCFGSFSIAAQGYMRFRHDGTNIIFETSPDNMSWTTLWTFVSPFSGEILKTLRPSYAAGYWGAETAPGKLVIDTINGSK